MTSHVRFLVHVRDDVPCCIGEDVLPSLCGVDDKFRGRCAPGDSQDAVRFYLVAR